MSFRHFPTIVVAWMASLLAVSQAQALFEHQADSISLVSTNVSASTSFQEPMHFKFSAGLNCNAASQSWVQIFDKSSNVNIPGRILCRSNTLTFVPQMILPPTQLANPDSGALEWIGLHASKNYEAHLSTTIVGSDGSALPALDPLPFKMSNVDYGIYWFNEFGYGEKRFVDIESPFITRGASTVVYVHGWQKGSVANNIWRGNPFLRYPFAGQRENLLPYWKNEFSNVGVMFWEQFADEAEPRYIEKKLWEVPKNSTVGIPFRDGNNVPSFLPSNRPLADVLCDDYDASMQNIATSSLRVIGHSSGSQIALHCAARNRVHNFSTPSRIVLLDPFWSRYSKDYLNSGWTGELARAKIHWLWSLGNVAIELYKSSLLGGLFGDSNLPIRKYAAFGRLWAEFIPLLDQHTHHAYSVSWYFESIKQGIPVSTGGLLGAAATDAQIRELMNSPESAQLRYFTSMGQGNLTSTATDDTFETRVGITTW